MDNFEFYNPVKVVYGAKTIESIGEEVKVYGKKALIVTYTHIEFMIDVFEVIHKSLCDSGIEYIDYCGVTANPTLDQARSGIEICNEKGIDVIIGVGGGSAMDCAKVIAAGVYYNEDLTRMISFSHSEDSQIPPTKALPMVLIPTLPATGSEMNPTAVITDEATTKKSYVWAPECLYAKTAIIDPELTTSLPAFQTACGAIDTIAHIVESYFNGTASNLDLQDRMQEGVIRTVLDNLPKVLENGNDVETRGVMMWASSIALNGWLLSGTYGWAPMHQMGHVLSARYNATHGATLATMILAWMRFFKDRDDNERYVQFAKRIYDETIDNAIDELEKFLVKAGVPTRIEQFGVEENDIDDLVDDVVNVSFNPAGMLASNPPLTREDVKQIYKLAL